MCGKHMCVCVCVCVCVYTRNDLKEERSRIIQELIAHTLSALDVKSNISFATCIKNLGKILNFSL